MSEALRYARRRPREAVLSMPRESFQQLPPERRERLLDAAAEELTAHGLLDASMNRILKRAGFSKGVAYHYFNDREDLLVTVLRDRFLGAVSDLEIDLEALSAESFWEDLSRLVGAATEPARWDSSAIEVARAVWHLPLEHRTRGAMGEFWEEMTGLLRGIIRRGQDLMVVRSDLPEELLVSAAMAVGEVGDRWFVEHWDADRPAEMERLGLQLVDMVRRVLEPGDALHKNTASAGERQS